MKALKLNRTYEILFVGILLISFALWLGTILFIDGQTGCQYRLFYGETWDFLADLLNPIGYASERDPYNNTMFTGTYAKQQPPLQYLLTYPFIKTVSMGPFWKANNFRDIFHVSTFMIILLILLLLLFVLAFFLISTRKKGGRVLSGATAIAILFSGPMLYTLERGNSVILVPFLCLLFLIYRNSKKAWLRELSIISLAFAAGLKLIPAVLGLILIYEKKWKMAIRAIIYGIAVVFLPFIIFKGGFSNFPLMLRNMREYMELFTYNEIGVSIRDVLNWIGGVSGAEIPHAIGYLLVIISTIAFLAGGFFAKKEWLRYLFLCLPMLSVPGHQGLYCIVYLIPVIIEFLNTENHNSSDFVFFLGIIIAFIPYQFPFLSQFSAFEIGMITIYIFAIYKSLQICFDGSRSLFHHYKMIV